MLPRLGWSQRARVGSSAFLAESPRLLPLAPGTPALPRAFPSSPQPGRYGKITTRLTFPETLDLSPYMAEGSVDAASGGGPPLYRLYAVVVHIDWGRSTDYGEQRQRRGLRDCVLQVHACSGSGVEQAHVRPPLWLLSLWPHAPTFCPSSPNNRRSLHRLCQKRR